MCGWLESVMSRGGGERGGGRLGVPLWERTILGFRLMIKFDIGSLTGSRYCHVSTGPWILSDFIQSWSQYVVAQHWIMIVDCSHNKITFLYSFSQWVKLNQHCFLILSTEDLILPYVTSHYSSSQTLGISSTAVCRSLGSCSLAQLVSQRTSRLPPTFFHRNEPQYIFGRVAFNPKMWCIFIMRGVFVFSCRAMARLPQLKDVRSEKKLSYNDSSHLEFMREAVWAVKDVLFYYCIWNVSRRTCMLKRLLIKHGSVCNLSLLCPLCQYQLL